MKINLGKDPKDQDVIADFYRENIHFILLAGTTGSGKSVFHYYLYKQLIDQNNPDELGFVFFDMTQVDFNGWKSPYLIEYLSDANLALEWLERLADETPRKTTVIHIEEANMALAHPERFEAALVKILKKKNVYIVFSTSRPSKDVLTPTIKKLIHLKMVFLLSSKADSEFVIGESLAEKFTEPGERVAIYNQKKIKLTPITSKETEDSENYFLS